MRSTVLSLSLALSTTAAVAVDPAGRARPQVVRDVENYAVASCLAMQPSPYLKDQGDAWASAVVQ